MNLVLKYNFRPKRKILIEKYFKMTMKIVSQSAWYSYWNQIWIATCRCINLFIGYPSVIAKGQLLEEFSILLNLIFLAQNLSRAETAFLTVLLDGVVEGLRHRVHLAVDDDLLIDRTLTLFASVRNSFCCFCYASGLHKNQEWFKTKSKVKITQLCKE